MRTSRTQLTMRIATAVMALAAMFAFMPVASAQVCPYNSTQGTCACPTTGPGVTCLGGQLYNSSAPFCRADVRPTGCTSFQQYNCATTSCQCNTASYPCGGCTLPASSTPNVTACASPINGKYTDQCSASCGCGAGTQLCAGTNTCVAVISCPAGTAFDPCTGACNSPNILKDQASPQSAFINVTGDIKSSAGDFYLPNGKSIRSDAAGTTVINVANFASTSAADVVNLNVDGMLSIGSIATQVAPVNLGAGTTGQNVLYGVATYNFMHPTGDFLLKLETWDSITGYTPRLSSNRDGDLVASGRLTAGSSALTLPVPSGPGDSSYAIQASLANASPGYFLRFMKPAAGDYVVTINSAGDIDTDGNMHMVGSLGVGAAALSKLDVGGGVAIGTYAGTLGAPANGLIVSGNTGLGTGSPGYPLDVRNSTAAGTTVLRLNNDNVTRLWTGTALARLATEKWFIGMNATDDVLRFRRNGTTDDATIDATGKLSVATLQVTGGTPGAGKVLISDVAGNATWQTIASNACTGVRKYVGSTAATYDGSRGGYKNADTICNGFSAGSTVCTAEEILNSYKCTTGSDPISSASGSNWVNAGPPGFTTFSNDCDGWTSSASVGGYYGRLWTFNAATDGKATVATCDNTLKYACCK